MKNILMEEKNLAIMIKKLKMTSHKKKQYFEY